MIFRMAGLLLLLSILPSLGHAQSVDPFEESDAAEQEAARAAFRDGRIAFDRGRYAEALERFEHAYSLSGKSELLYNIGLAADRIREDERALEAFELYLKETPDSPERDQVRMRVVALREARARARARKEGADAGEGRREARGKHGEDRDGALVPMPAEVASAQQRDPEHGRQLSYGSSQRDDDGILSSWWFWTAASVLLVAGGVTAYVLLQPDEQAELPRPNTGRVVMTLRHAP